MTPTGSRVLESSAAKIELDVTVDAPADKVWRAIVEEPDAWWVSELRCVPGESTITLEPRAGGVLIESNREGGSLLWFTVIAIEPGRSINLAGAIAPPFGGPSNAFLLIELEQCEGATVMKLTNSMHGHVNEDSLAPTEAGWRLLFERGLKRFVETGQRA